MLVGFQNEWYKGKEVRSQERAEKRVIAVWWVNVGKSGVIWLVISASKG